MWDSQFPPKDVLLRRVPPTLLFYERASSPLLSGLACGFAIAYLSWMAILCCSRINPFCCLYKVIDKFFRLREQKLIHRNQQLSNIRANHSVELIITEEKFSLQSHLKRYNSGNRCKNWGRATTQKHLMFLRNATKIWTNGKAYILM